MSPIMFCHVETNPLVGIYTFSSYFLKERIKKKKKKEKKYDQEFFSGQAELSETDVQLGVPTLLSPSLEAWRSCSNIQNLCTGKQLKGGLGKQVTGWEGIH